MARKQDETEVYIIPPNFIETGTLFGGSLKMRNVIEAGILSAAIGLPIFNLHLSLTTKIVIACLTVLPAGLFALIGVSGESLSAFIINFFKFVFRRRIIGKNEKKGSGSEGEKKKSGPINRIVKKIQGEEQRNGILVRKKTLFRGSVWIKAISQVANYLPIDKVDNGVIYTKDKRYVKVIEIVPINFLLRSAREQKNIIYSFISFLKISPVKMQIKVLTKRADINKHLKKVQEEIKNEKDEAHF